MTKRTWPELDGFAAATTRILTVLKPSFDALKSLDWEPSAGALPVIRASILVRQYECLEAIVHLVENHFGYAAVPLLRPACEELIWAKYLTQLTVDQANRLLSVVVADEHRYLLKAQDDYAGRTVTRQLGLLTHLNSALAARDHVADRMQEIGAELGWDAKTVERKSLPTLRFFAQRTALIELYNFLYHATSRFSHFSTIELLRRAWGKPGEISISSTHFEWYWSAFALRWGLRLFLDTVDELREHVRLSDDHELDLSDEDARRIFEHIECLGNIPIVTSEELQWPY